MMKRILFIFFVIAMFCATIVCAQEEVTYTIDMPNPANHIFDVTVKFKTTDTDCTIFMLPVGVPGWYEEKYYAKDVQEFSAFDELAKSLKCERSGLSAWKVYHKKNQTITIKYRVYSNAKEINNSYLNSQRSLINPASVCMYVENKTNLPCNLTVNFPKYWEAATSLKKTGKNNFYAPNYNVLADSPIIAGNLKIKKIKYKDADYYIVINSMIKFDMEKAAVDVEKIMKKQVDTLGGVPFKEYYFMYIIYPDAANGLEHSASCVLGCPPERFDYNNFLLGFSHEFFHLWNDKCIYAENIYPYNYNEPNLTRMYWFFEGFTTYYTSVFVKKTDLMKENSFFEKIIRKIENQENINSAKHISLEDASFAGWYLEPQNRDENSLDFYEKGALIALITDLEIRHKTKNKKSLDDVMRYLYANYGLKNTGIKENELEDIFKKASGVDLKEIFDNYIRGTKAIDYNKYLNYAGLELKIKEDDKKPYFGIESEHRGDQIKIKKVKKDSPAQIAGLAADDVIIAIDGIRVINKDYLKGYKEKDKITVTFFRNNMLMTKQVVLTEKGEKKYSVEKLKEPTALQKGILKSWLED